MGPKAKKAPAAEAEDAKPPQVKRRRKKEPEAQPLYNVDDEVLCRFTGRLYDAVVLDVQPAKTLIKEWEKDKKTKAKKKKEEGTTEVEDVPPPKIRSMTNEQETIEDGFAYYLHYRHWSTNWDEWVRSDCLLAITDESRAEQKKLKLDEQKEKLLKKRYQKKKRRKHNRRSTLSQSQSGGESENNTQTTCEEDQDGGGDSSKTTDVEDEDFQAIEKTEDVLVHSEQHQAEIETKKTCESSPGSPVATDKTPAAEKNSTETMDNLIKTEAEAKQESQNSPELENLQSNEASSSTSVNVSESDSSTLENESESTIVTSSADGDVDDEKEKPEPEEAGPTVDPLWDHPIGPRLGSPTVNDAISELQKRLSSMETIGTNLAGAFAKKMSVLFESFYDEVSPIDAREHVKKVLQEVGVELYGDVVHCSGLVKLIDVLESGKWVDIVTMSDSVKVENELEEMQWMLKTNSVFFDEAKSVLQSKTIGGEASNL